MLSSSGTLDEVASDAGPSRRRRLALRSWGQKKETTKKRPGRVPCLGFMAPELLGPSAPALGGSWVEINGVMSRGTILITHIQGLITQVITTHEPPSRGMFGCTLGTYRLSPILEDPKPRASTSQRAQSPLNFGLSP